MKIAFVSQPFDNMTPPVRGGSLSMWIYYMARICARRGHEVTVFGNHGSRLHSKKCRHDGVEYVFTRTLVDSGVNRLGRIAENALRAIGMKRGTNLSTNAGWHHWGYAREVARHIRNAKCDVVHIMGYSQFVPVIRRAYPDVRIALHMQCEWLTQFPRKVIEPRLRQVDLIIGCSEYITRLVADGFPEFADKCVTVPNSADVIPEGSAAVPAGEKVLFVGRISPEKGIHDLITAFHLVLERFPEASLHLVGAAGSAPIEYLVGLSDVPYVKDLSRFYERPPLANGKDPYLVTLEELAGPELGRRITFEGRADHDKISDHYRNAAVLVNPSLSESFGISLVEAMMLKKPVVATRVGGMAHTVIPGETGLLVDPANPNALAEAICKVLEDPALARQMGEAGRKRAVGHFSWERSADLLLEVYRARPCHSEA
ncbi:MAG: glycosyltransferase family 4 protein [Opitutaceae bacterium]